MSRRGGGLEKRREEGRRGATRRDQVRWACAASSWVQGEEDVARCDAMRGRGGGGGCAESDSQLATTVVAAAMMGSGPSDVVVVYGCIWQSIGTIGRRRNNKRGAARERTMDRPGRGGIENNTSRLEELRQDNDNERCGEARYSFWSTIARCLVEKRIGLGEGWEDWQTSEQHGSSFAPAAEVEWGRGAGTLGTGPTIPIPVQVQYPPQPCYLTPLSMNYLPFVSFCPEPFVSCFNAMKSSPAHSRS